MSRSPNPNPNPSPSPSRSPGPGPSASASPSPSRDPDPSPASYEQDLAWRRDVIGAASVKQLCKSMIMENTKLADKPLAQCQAEGKVKFVCVVVQYDGPKLHKEKLTEIVRALPCSVSKGRAVYPKGRAARGAGR